MAKAAYDAIRDGLSDALSHAEGGVKKGKVSTVAVDTVDVRAARERLGLSQSAFAATFQLSVSTVRKWEQGERRPTGAAKTLMTIIDRAPDAALKALRST